jgi:hypothetical protein
VVFVRGKKTAVNRVIEKGLTRLSQSIQDNEEGGIDQNEGRMLLRRLQVPKLLVHTALSSRSMCGSSRREVLLLPLLPLLHLLPLHHLET